MSKHQLLEHWPDPLIVRDVAKLVGFAQFYSQFLPHFVCRITRLREILKEEYTLDITPFWNDAAVAEWKDIKTALLADPCIGRYDHRKLLVIRTDFSALGFGYAALQPGDDPASVTAMHTAMSGGDFQFMTKEHPSLTLKPVAFGSRRTRGNETRLHSYLGEAMAGDWAINKCRHMTFGQRFIWITDSYAVRFLLTYDGNWE